MIRHDLEGVDEEELLKDIHNMELQFDGREFNVSIENKVYLEKEIAVMEANII